MITNIYNNKNNGPTLMELPKGTDDCSSEEYQCMHVEARVART
jgi:hypothetical protein